jgi:hypothetical protein
VTADVQWEGGCLCGHIRYLATGDPLRVAHCHCTMCRKSSGGIALTFAAFPIGSVEWSQPPGLYESSKIAWRGFCPRCGSTLSYNFRHRPTEILMAVGSFDRAERLPAAQYHSWTSQRLEWASLDRDLPGYERWRHTPSVLD